MKKKKIVSPPFKQQVYQNSIIAREDKGNLAIEMRQCIKKRVNY